MTDDDFHHSANPTATQDQREMEKLALQVMAMPAIAAAKAQVQHRWRPLSARKLQRKLAALEHALPTEMRLCSRAERQTQLDERVQTFSLRYIDN